MRLVPKQSGEAMGPVIRAGARSHRVVSALEAQTSVLCFPNLPTLLEDSHQKYPPPPVIWGAKK